MEPEQSKSFNLDYTYCIMLVYTLGYDMSFVFRKKKKNDSQFKNLCHAARKGAQKGSQARKKRHQK
jgi:hypothetical protein